MKKALLPRVGIGILGLLLLFPFPSRSQAHCPAFGLPVDSARCQVTYRAMVLVPGATQNALYRQAKWWAVLHFPQGQRAIELDDPQGGRLIVRGYLRYAASATAPEVWRTLVLDVKEARYRYQVSDFALVVPHLALVRQGKIEALLRAAGSAPGAGPMPRHQYLQRTVSETTLLELTSLQKAMGDSGQDF